MLPCGGLRGWVLRILIVAPLLLRGLVREAHRVMAVAPERVGLARGGVRHRRRGVVENCTRPAPATRLGLFTATARQSSENNYTCVIAL